MGGRTVFIIAQGEIQHALAAGVRSAGWEIHSATDIASAQQQLEQHRYCVGLVQIDKHFLNGEQAHLEQLLRACPEIEWIGITEESMLPQLLEHNLIPGYFHDYHTLPVDPQRLSHCIGHAYGMAWANYQARDQRIPQAMNGMIGSSNAMQHVMHNIRKIAAVDAPVILHGESGTGKELAARAIHDHSKRRKAPFIAINCGAIPGNLIQSELFGHEKGAFTGAHQRKSGRIETANGGTIFLDEIADLPLELQVNLLRFLQENTIERVGGTDTISVNVRVIAASHTDLQQAAAQGTFREDLYYRLNVLQLGIPPLRERKQDIEPLARYFFSTFAPERNDNISGFSQEAIHAMQHYNWPGNIRELINKVRRATVMCEHRLITPGDLDLPAQFNLESTETLEYARNKAEKNAIQVALRNSHNNITSAARQLGIARVTLYRLLHKYKMATNHDQQGSRHYSHSCS